MKAKERYRLVLKRLPKIEKRIPAFHLASYPFSLLPRLNRKQFIATEKRIEREKTRLRPSPSVIFLNVLQ